MTEKTTKKTARTTKKAVKPKETDAAAPVAEPLPAEKPRSSALLPILMIIVIVQIGFAGFYAWKLEQTKATPNAVAEADIERIVEAYNALDTRIKALEDEVQTVNDTLKELDSNAHDGDDASDDISELEDRISDVEIALETLDDAHLSDDKIAELIAAKNGIEALQKTVSTEQKNQLQSVAQLTALDQVAQGVQSGEPYAGSLTALTQSLADAPDLLALAAPFKPYQQGDAPTMKTLKRALTQTVDEYYASVDETDSPALSGLLQNLSSLITIRKVGDTHEGDDDASRIARAEAALNDHKLSLAIDELESLSESAKTQFETWLQRANDYTVLRKNLTALRAQIHANIQTAE